MVIFVTQFLSKRSKTTLSFIYFSLKAKTNISQGLFNFCTWSVFSQSVNNKTSYHAVAIYRVSSSSDKFQHPNDVCIAGYSDQILRFVAERGNGGQLNHVENIDKAYGLQSRAVSRVFWCFIRVMREVGVKETKGEGKEERSGKEGQ